MQLGRTPQGVRGLKYTGEIRPVETAWSHPARGAWIEIAQRDIQPRQIRRTPQGVRGLKSKRCCLGQAVQASHPARGAWIEIRRCNR